MQFLRPILHTLAVWRFRRKIERYNLGLILQQEAAVNLSADDVMVFFQPGVNAPDVPIIMSYWHALVLMVGVLTGVGLIFYLMVHLSPPLW